MTTRALVAVSHELKASKEADDILMSPYCRLRATNDLLPLVTDKSLLLIEGFEHNTFVPSSHLGYDLLHNREKAWLGEIRPTFAGFDPRATSPQMCDLCDARYQQWQKLVKEVVDTDWSVEPQSFTNVKAMLENDIPQARLNRPVSREEIELARWILTISRKFDRLYLEALGKNGNRFDTILCLVGSIHALSMSMRSSHQVIDLTEPSDAHYIYYAYLEDYHWPRLFF
jgi:hypothetical protein